MIKYKVLHFILWIVLSFLLMGIDYDSRVALLPQLLGTMVAVAFAVPACYFAAFRLVPAYLYNKKIKTFISLLAVLITVNTAITYIATLFTYHLLTGLPMFRSFEYVLYIGYVILFYDIMFISISCAAKILADRFHIEKRLHQVEKERISTELNFLRSQINPHFLFNVLNTIYFQIDKENARAKSSVETLSEMLRYQLYECTTDKIDIGKELDYIRNYVAMHSLRMEKETDISLSIDKNLSGFVMAPLLLLPLIENAFKHVSQFKNASENKIHITLNYTGNAHFCIHIINSYDRFNHTRHLLNSGGLGMQNLQRRLDLLYPHRHEFSITPHEGLFETTLKIKV